MTEPTKKIAYVTWGAASQITSFQDFAKYLDDMIYLRELETHDLSRYAAVVVPDGTDPVAHPAPCGPAQRLSARRRLPRHLRLRQGE